MFAGLPSGVITSSFPIHAFLSMMAPPSITALRPVPIDGAPGFGGDSSWYRSLPMTTEVRIVAPLDAPIITCATSEETDELSPGMNTARYYLRNKTKTKNQRRWAAKILVRQ